MTKEDIETTTIWSLQQKWRKRYWKRLFKYNAEVYRCKNFEQADQTHIG